MLRSEAGAWGSGDGPVDDDAKNRRRGDKGAERAGWAGATPRPGRRDEHGRGGAPKTIAALERKVYNSRAITRHNGNKHTKT